MPRTASPTISPAVQDRLEAWRAAQDMSLTEVAKRMDWQYSYVCDILRGDRPMSEKFMWDFCETFGFDLAPIFTNGNSHGTQDTHA